MASMAEEHRRLGHGLQDDGQKEVRQGYTERLVVFAMLAEGAQH